MVKWLTNKPVIFIDSLEYSVLFVRSKCLPNVDVSEISQELDLYFSLQLEAFYAVNLDHQNTDRKNNLTPICCTG